MFYVIGLGNPGEKYKNTRHNVGFALVDALREKHGLPDWVDDTYANALQTSGAVTGEPVALYKPQTYMNNSGDTARYLVDKQGVKPEEIIVVYDDVDLALGEVKISVGRGDGGHNGIKSLVGQIGKEFIRVRVGVASKSLWTGEVKRPGGKALSQHVLGRFSFLEKGGLEQVQEKTELAIETIVTKGVAEAMNVIN